MRQIALDTETTGLYTKNGDRIIEIGCVEIIDRKITGKFFHSYFNPGCKIGVNSLAITGISDDFLLDKPKFSQVVDDFLKFIDGAELIIHNAVFDLEFINYELQLVNHSIQDVSKICSVMDTLMLARSIHPGQRNSLDALIKRYNIETSRKFHGALVDANILAQVALKMTAGQISFDFNAINLEIDLEVKCDDNIEQPSKNFKLRDDLKMVYASSKELELHQKYLNEIHNSN